MENKNSLNIKRNKRAQISSTLTWFFAFLVIFFIIFLFLVATLLLAGKNAVTRKNVVSVDGYTTGSIESQRAFIAFLDKPVGFGSEIIKIKDLIASGDEAKLVKYKELAEQFMKENFPIERNKFRNYWLRIYDAGQKIEQNPPLGIREWKYGSYEIKKQLASVGSHNCNPSYEKNKLSDEGPAIFTYFFINDKKIALCVEHY